MRGTFGGFRTVEEQRRSQIVVHGPMLYVDSPLPLHRAGRTGLGEALRNDLPQVARA